MVGGMVSPEPLGLQKWFTYQNLQNFMRIRTFGKTFNVDTQSQIIINVKIIIFKCTFKEVRYTGVCLFQLFQLFSDCGAHQDHS